MEEIREAALAYYENFSNEQKKSARKIFQELDSNGDGNISLSEYTEYLKQRGHKMRVTNFNFFKDLDKDGNGYLDFDEFIVLHYLRITGRFVFCDGCGVFLKGLFFTCVQCFKPGKEDSYDLCCLCYRNQNFEHHDDAVFYDNYALLLTKEFTTPKKEKLNEAFEIVKLGMEIGNIAANGGCNIM